MLKRSPFLSGYLTLIIALFLFNFSSAQEQRFNAGLVVGLNASQIDGDQLAGFDKLGLTAWVRGIAKLGETIDMNIEFLYSERGSKPDAFDAVFEPDIHIEFYHCEFAKQYRSRCLTP